MNNASLVLDFYSISLKRGLNGKLKYGQEEYNFDEGVMFSVAPHQVFRVEHDDNEDKKPTGWMLLIHPDFLWSAPLAKAIKRYGFFGYAVHEALWLLEKEEAVLNNIVENIRQEYRANLDKYGKQIIIAQIESLLSYAERFYNRQFITREKAAHQLLDRLEGLLIDYFNSDDLTKTGLPTVQYVAEALHVSPNYLSGLLRTLTGQNTRQFIHEKLMERAKEKLSTTSLSVSEIAYDPGFEHLPSFSKLFKAKTALSPLAFRQSFN